jgi:hypothetical protein
MFSSLGSFFQGDTWKAMNQGLNAVSSAYGVYAQAKNVDAEYSQRMLSASASRAAGIAEGEDLLRQAELLDLESESIRLSGLWEEMKIRSQLNRAVSSNRAVMAASGVQRSGSALAVLGRQFSEAGKDLAASRYSHGTAELSSRMRGSLTRMRAASAASQGEVLASSAQVTATAGRAAGRLETAGMLSRYGQRGTIY